MSLTPLEFVDSEKYGNMDEVQKELICEYNALDLILLENANEIFRQFMIESDEGNIEELLDMFKEENSNSIFLRSDTVDIKENKEYDWSVKTTQKNKKTIETYIQNAVYKINKSKIINDDTVIYTIFGLNLVAGGHYGGIVCDLGLKKVYIFDSMSGNFGYDEMKATTEPCFLYVAEKIFNNTRIKNALKKKLDIDNEINFEFEFVNISYILQPTGGFTEIIAPDLEFMEDEDIQMKINIQHSESQNHFCYIWSCLFCHMYLRGKLEIFNTFLKKCELLEIVPLVIIKIYILGFVTLLESDTNTLENKTFFYKHFPRIWSNHENVQTLLFELYEIKYNKSYDIKSCLDNVLNIENQIIKINKSSSRKIKTKLRCLSEDDFSKESTNNSFSRLSQKRKTIKSLPELYKRTSSKRSKSRKKLPSKLASY